MKPLTLSTTFLLFCLSLLLSQPLSADEALDEAALAGQDIFEAECQQCHGIEDAMVGPALQNVTERRDEDWLISFISNASQMKEDGDEIALELDEEYAGQMPVMDYLSEEEIENTLAYIDQASAQVEEEEEPVATDDEDPEATAPAPDVDDDWINRLIIGVIILLILTILLALNILFKLLRLRGYKVDTNPDNWINWQRTNAILMPTFLIVGFALIIYELIIHNQWVVFPNNPSASEHGTSIDNMFIATLIITGIVFVVTQIMLFVFAYKYRYQKNAKGHFYPENDKLEFFWTIIPAIVLSTLVFFGYTSWSDITYEQEGDDELKQVEVLGYQFDWRFRYPGESGELGAVDYKLFDDNQMGLDFDDENARDDIVSRTLYLPVDQEVMLNFRSRDVLHSAHMPDFRLQMYTTPGMPSQFRLEPTKTTEEMREELDDEDFNYELACNQICGVGHHNMRAEVKIVEQDEFEDWLDEQDTFYESRR